MSDHFSLKIEGMEKRFSGVTVLKDINLEISGGEIHAIVGENGAGKSTLMMLIGGIHNPDKGNIYFNNKPVTVKSPMEAQQYGIAIVYQELSLVPTLTVAENIFAGREERFYRWFADRKRMNKEAQDLVDRLGGEISVSQRVDCLSVAKKQIVEIAKAISRKAKVLILDEPTSSLNDTEADLLFKVMQDLRNKGVAIVFISHRLKEVFKIADRITVLRDGCLVNTVATGDVDERELIKMMVGREMTAFYPAKSSQIRNVVLEVKNFSTFTGVHDATFQVHQGEILGIAGLVGAGRTEMAKAIFGIDPKKKGKIIFEGKQVEITSPADAMALGMGYLPEERKVAGLYLEMSIKSNIISNNLHQAKTAGGFISGKSERRIALENITQLDIQARFPEQRVLKLSGGNQQKVLIAKWITGKPKLLIIDEPTRGVDVGAKYEIHCLLRKLAEQGMAIIMISSDLPEVLGMSDRIMVMNQGGIATIIKNHDRLTQEELMTHATIGNKALKAVVCGKETL